MNKDNSITLKIEKNIYQTGEQINGVCSLDIVKK